LILFLPKKIFGNDSNNDCEVTTTDIEGPFYLENSPNVYNITPFNINENFNFINISGTIYANDCISTIKNVQIDVWQANVGEFDPKTNEFINSNYEDNSFRGTITSNDNGNYSFLTIKPGKYLNGSYYRPSHIHFKLKYGNLELTTQLYFEGDSTIPIDFWASSESAQDRIISLSDNENGIQTGVFDIILDVNSENLYVSDNKLINSIFPNPINEETKVNLNKHSREYSVVILDCNSRIISRFKIRSHSFYLFEHISSNTPRGIYILKIKNDKNEIQTKKIVI
tara:strand:- start:1332 stop:2180 length:849 start_codon:yes stop_codon:yes gene_type:complete